MARHIIATTDELPPGGRKRVTVAGRTIALFRIGEEYHAIQDRCPHEGASLCAGHVTGLAVSNRPGTYSLERQGEMLRCPWHGWEFDIRTGQSWCDPERIRVRSFQTSVEPGAALAKGSYVAETYPVTVERDYVLIEVGPPGWIDAVVTRRTEEAEGVVVLELARADGTPLPPFDPGAHIDVQAMPGLVRQYSLCGDVPGDDTETPALYRIAVLREPRSRGGSAAIHDTLREDAPLRIGPPRSHFRLDPAARRSVLIAGGIGITPLLGMAAALHRAGADFALHYLAQSPGGAAFLGELRDGPLASHLRTWFSADGMRFDIAQAMEEEPDATFYVCGPLRLIDAAAEAHRRLGLPPERLVVERFTAEVEKGGAPFTVEAARSGLTLEVPADRSLAEVLVENDVPVELSCEQGVCGTCLVTVLEGTPEHRDLVQTRAEKASNRRMAVCCSRAATAHLVLDV